MRLHDVGSSNGEEASALVSPIRYMALPDLWSMAETAHSPNLNAGFHENSCICNEDSAFSGDMEVKKH